MDAIDLIKRHEGFRRYAYKDTRGVLTIGYGFNLDAWMAYGIPVEEADGLLAAKVRIAAREASLLPGWARCNDVRRAVLTDMVYNMGLTRVQGFRKMLTALDAGDFKRAAAEMLDSRWAEQTGIRAQELSELMSEGVWP